MKSNFCKLNLFSLLPSNDDCGQTWQSGLRVGSTAVCECVTASIGRSLDLLKNKKHLVVAVCVCVCTHSYGIRHVNLGFMISLIAILHG